MTERPHEELFKAIAGLHALMPGAESFMIMAFLPGGEVAVFGNTNKQHAAKEMRKWGREVLLGKKRTRTVVGDTTQEKQ